jgi:MFS family permease
MRRTPALAVLLLCAFVVNVDTTIVNVALPTLSVALDASTRDLQWIVDAYTLAFAALVLAAGGLGDRFGRKRLLLIGLVVYFVGNGAAALADTSGALIGWRAVMGIGAAIIFPTTLSTIVHLYPKRDQRAKAIGLWGAVTGISVALGPIVGGALLESSGWQAAFWLKLPIAALAFALVLAVVPESADPARPPVDRIGLGLSTLGVFALVFTIIEAPEYGWLAPRSIAGFAVAAVALAGFVAYESRAKFPLLDVRLFRNARFSAASVAITFSFFALFGFIFLITQYFQILRGYGAFETGLRLLPVALSTGMAAVVGTTLAVRVDLAGRRRDFVPGARRPDDCSRHCDGLHLRASDRVDHGSGSRRQCRHRLWSQRHDPRARGNARRRRDRFGVRLAVRGWVRFGAEGVAARRRFGLSRWGVRHRRPSRRHGGISTPRYRQRRFLRRTGGRVSRRRWRMCGRLRVCCRAAAVSAGRGSRRG